MATFRPMGIDPGFRGKGQTGVAIFADDVKLMSDVLRSQEDSYQDRVADLRCQIWELIEEFGVTHVVIDKPVMGRHRNARTFGEQWFMVGTLVALCWDLNVQVVVLQWNQIFKRALGKGNLSKEEAAQMLAEMGYKFKTTEYDETDATCAALAARVSFDG